MPDPADYRSDISLQIITDNGNNKLRLGAYDKVDYFLMIWANIGNRRVIQKRV